MLELVANLVVDLSDQRLIVYNSDQEAVRVIPVSTGKASTPNTDLRQQGPYKVPLQNDVLTHLRRSRGAVHDVRKCERGHLPTRRPLAGERMPINHARWLFHNTPKGTPMTIQA